MSSRVLFQKHFSESALNDVIDLHLAAGVARGVDGTTYEGFLKRRSEEVGLISKRAISGDYRFSPYRQKLILKNADSPPRQVSIPTLRDRVALRAVNNFLSEVFHDCRPQHAHPVISGVLQSLKTMTATDTFIKLDIQSFYDAVDHEILLKNLRSRVRSEAPLEIIRRALKTPTGVTVSSGEKNVLGIPQGLSISNILSSIYLKSVDDKFGSMLDLKYHRYVDDILGIASDLNADDFAQQIAKELKRKKKLVCHPLGSGKSRISTQGEGVTYLGYSISSDKVSVRTATEKKLMTNIMEIVFGAKPSEWKRAVWRINLRITGCKLAGTKVGWIFYFSQISDKQLLKKMDLQIARAVEARFGSAALGETKKLLRSYHEIKFRHRDSSYFPDFELYSRDQMIGYLELLVPGRYKNLDRKTDQELSRIFKASVWREVKRMEKDTIGAFS